MSHYASNEIKFLCVIMLNEMLKNFIVLVNYTVKDNSHISLLVVYVVEGLTSVKQIDGRICG